VATLEGLEDGRIGTTAEEGSGDPAEVLTEIAQDSIGLGSCEVYKRISNMISDSKQGCQEEGKPTVTMPTDSETEAATESCSSDSTAAATRLLIGPIAFWLCVV
jgi:hypothetical protein